MTNKIQIVFLFASMVSFIYFSILVLDAYWPLNLPNDFRIIGELVTIPLLIIPFICLGMTTLKMINKQADAIVRITFGISLLTVMLLTIATATGF